MTSNYESIYKSALLKKYKGDSDLEVFMFAISVQFSSVQSLSRVQLCNPMDCSTPGLPVHHQLPEFTQIHVQKSLYYLETKRAYQFWNCN